jgi:ubiquitin-protein ligase
MSMVRLKRLQADFDRLTRLCARHPRLQLLRVEGEPAEKYQLEYRVTSMRQKDGVLLTVDSHVVEIVLPRDYPRTPPLCRMLTPVFHPNIAPHAICIGDHWSAGESLPSLVTRIGEMLAYQSYNTKSPLNGEAAKWTDQNIERLPLDGVNMQVEEPGNGQPAPPPPLARAQVAGTAVAPPLPPPRVPIAPAPQPPLAVSPVPPPAAPAPAAPVRARVDPMTSLVTCPGCGAKIRAKPELGAQVRCPRCKTVLLLSP